MPRHWSDMSCPILCLSSSLFSINIGGVIMALASLSFLGFGLPPKIAELGRYAQPGRA